MSKCFSSTDTYPKFHGGSVSPERVLKASFKAVKKDEDKQSSSYVTSKGRG